ncbi:MAG: DUF4258 domain-containing protein [Candidatus Hodarchaeales archaeon]
MKIHFTEHAMERINSRNISADQIRDAIAQPDEQYSNSLGRVIHKLLINDDSKEECLLRVFYKEDNDSITIISAYKTSKIKKYWKGEFNED